jgi:methylated-DNA-[protein]-cysteine S-methyltransferase
MANHDNPVAIVVPCHRVIASDGTLGGYGGGLPAKRWLLELEGIKFEEQLKLFRVAGVA